MQLCFKFQLFWNIVIDNLPPRGHLNQKWPLRLKRQYQPRPLRPSPEKDGHFIILKCFHSTTKVLSLSHHRSALQNASNDQFGLEIAWANVGSLLAYNCLHRLSRLRFSWTSRPMTSTWGTTKATSRRSGTSSWLSWTACRPSTITLRYNFGVKLKGANI